MMKSVGRNESCPCGSGKKYKKCCGAKEAVSITHVIEGEVDDLQKRLIHFLIIMKMKYLRGLMIIKITLR